jgi:hypothetical protein
MNITERLIKKPIERKTKKIEKKTNRTKTKRLIGKKDQ